MKNIKDKSKNKEFFFGWKDFFAVAIITYILYKALFVVYGLIG